MGHDEPSSLPDSQFAVRYSPLAPVIPLPRLRGRVGVGAFLRRSGLQNLDVSGRPPYTSASPRDGRVLDPCAGRYGRSRGAGMKEDLQHVAAL